MLVYLVDLAATDRDPVTDYEVLRNEIESFDRELAQRPSLVIASKIDVGKERLDQVAERIPNVLPVSAVTGEGLEELLRKVHELVMKARAEAPTPTAYVRHVTPDEPLEVRKENSGWRVVGRRAERAVAATNMDNEEAVERLQRSLISMGVERTLDKAGARAGDEVRIGDMSFDYEPEHDGAA